MPAKRAKTLPARKGAARKKTVAEGRVAPLTVVDGGSVGEGRRAKGKGVPGKRRRAGVSALPSKKKAKAKRKTGKRATGTVALRGKAAAAPAAVEDGSVPLEDGQHERFCLLMARGIFSNYSCYLQAYGDDQKGESARSSASRLLTNANIEARIEWLRKRAAEGVVYEINDTLKWLVDVIKTPVGYLDDESPLVQEVTRDIIGSEEEGVTTKVKIKMPSKMDAQKLMVDIRGWKKSDKDQETAADALTGLLSWIRGGGNVVPKAPQGQ